MSDRPILSGLRCVSIAAALIASPAGIAFGAPVLRSAAAHITVASPTSCDVAMTLSVDGVTEVEHRLEAFEDSQVELTAVRGARQIGEVRTIGRTRSLVLRPDGAEYGFSYHASRSANAADRCPIWLPTVATDGRSRAVRLEIDLPPATAPRASMPAFAWNGTHGVATIGHVPAVVRAPYVAEGEARPWDTGTVIDALTIATFVVATAVWTWRARR